MTHKAIWSILKRSATAWNEHETPRLAAALAFYAILSLAPLVILMIPLIALILGDATSQNHLLGHVDNMLGREGSDAVKGMLEHARKPASGMFASIAGLITLLFGASGVFAELRAALNTIWNAQAQSQRGAVWDTVAHRLFSFGMVLAVGLLLVALVLTSTVLAALSKFFSGFLPIPASVLSLIDLVVSMAGTAVLFALIFRYVPETNLAWRKVWFGAGVTAVLFTIGKFLIGLYLGKAAVGSAYGAAGSLVVVIVWVYYSAMVFLFGAEFTHALDARPAAEYPEGKPGGPMIATSQTQSRLPSRPGLL